MLSYHTKLENLSNVNQKLQRMVFDVVVSTAAMRCSNMVQIMTSTTRKGTVSPANQDAGMILLVLGLNVIEITNVYGGSMVNVER